MIETEVVYQIKYVNKGKQFHPKLAMGYATYTEDQKEFAKSVLFELRANPVHKNIDFYLICTITTTKVIGDAEQI